MLKKIFYAIILQLFTAAVFAQASGNNEKLKGWHLLNQQQDGYLGTGVKEAYELLKNKKSTTVIIAVIDSGIDTVHEDLKTVLWTNSKEVAGNGVDDDGNGYKDDVHGWNFCGAADGTNLETNTHEIARLYHGWKNEFEGKKEKDIPADRKFLFGQWKRAAALLDKQYTEYEKNFPNVDRTYKVLQLTGRIVSTHLSKTSFIKNDIALIQARDSVGWAVEVWKDIFSQGSDASITNTAIIAEVESYRNVLLNNKKRKDDLPVDFRAALTKDKYTDIKDSIYGNNNLKSGSGNHGTHVSGIIGAARNNSIGIDGIVDNVRIMAIRAVPGGDEHDKDVALAIRYAVNNGASIINMSFGKPVSPYKQFVDDAIKYAASKNVLVVHGSGNDGEDLDENVFYPNAFFLDGTTATNMLTVGASGDHSTGNLVAPFSNYSNKVVDIFAPGVYINSTTTNNGYEPFDGTSMASPVAAGVAGLIKSYFPSLTPQQIIELLMRTGITIQEEVNCPGSDKKVAMKKLCKSGKIINAYEAVKLALQLYGN